MQTKTFDAYYDGDLVFTEGDYMLITDRDAFKNVLKLKTAISAGDFLADTGLGNNLMQTLGQLKPSASDKEIKRAVKGEIVKALFYSDPFLASVASIDVSVANTQDRAIDVVINFNDQNVVLPQSMRLNFVYTYAGWEVYIED